MITMESLIVLAIIVFVAVLLIRKLTGAVQGSGGRARAGRPRADHSVPELVKTLRAGGLPQAIPVGFPLQPGEMCVGVVEADVEQWLEGDGSYTHKSVGWAGGLAGLAIGSAMNAAGNASRKAAARREAAERWRLVGRYRIYITTARVAFDGGGGREWHESWLEDVRRIEPDHSAIAIQSVGATPTRIHAAPAEYWALLLRRLAFGELPQDRATA
jgi:hypothetical protein